jgi:hypothetical protein
LFVARGGNEVVFSRAASDTAELAYTVPSAPTRHVITDLTPGARYAVRAEPGAGQLQLRIAPAPGGTFVASAAGVLAFGTSANGVHSTR